MTKRLQLDWPGKAEHVLQDPETGKWKFCGDAPLPPRPLIEVQSYGDEQERPLDPHCSNLLIKGENLFALRALLPYFEGRVKLIYIDPPFNTGREDIVAFDDNFKHSVWLSMVHERLLLAQKLLREDGVCFVHIDSNEAARLALVMDEVFSPTNFMNLITMTTSEPSGFKATSTALFSTANYLLVYAKARSNCFLKRVFRPKDYDRQYSKFLLNPDDHFSKWQWTPLPDECARHHGYESARDARAKLGRGEFNELVAQFAIENADRVFRTAVIRGGARQKRRQTIEKSRADRGKVYVHPGEDLPGFYILNGEQILFYKDRLVEIDGDVVPGELITDVWTDISWTGIAGEGGVTLKEGKKPEPLIQRVIELASDPGQLVLDFFAGSGTTGAVAHKMRRRWIMVELNQQAEELALPRMQRVISGEDHTGITAAVNWQGGGGFRFLEVGAPLLIEDPDTQITILNPEYTNGPLIRAVCAVEGFLLTGHRLLHGRNGDHFAHVTEEFVDQAFVTHLKACLQEGQMLTIYAAKGLRRGLVLPEAVVVKRIPTDLLKRYAR